MATTTIALGQQITVTFTILGSDSGAVPLEGFYLTAQVGDPTIVKADVFWGNNSGGSQRVVSSLTGTSKVLASVVGLKAGTTSITWGAAPLSTGGYVGNSVTFNDTFVVTAARTISSASANYSIDSTS